MVDVDFDLTGIESFQAEIEDTAAEWEDGGGYKVTVGANYGVYVEYGTRYMAGQPYLRPAVDKTKAQLGAIAVNADGLDEFLQKAALTVERSAKASAPVDTGYLRSSISTSRI
jgi:hypothetical protein